MSCSSGFIDNHCGINDGNEFLTPLIRSAQSIQSLKLSTKYGSFLSLIIKIEKAILVYKLSNNRDKFPLFIVQMSHLPSNKFSE